MYSRRWRSCITVNEETEHCEQYCTVLWRLMRSMSRGTSHEVHVQCMMLMNYTMLGADSPPPQKKIKNSDVDHFSRYAKTSLAQFPWVPRPASQCHFNFFAIFKNGHSAIDWLYFYEVHSKKLANFVEHSRQSFNFQKIKGTIKMNNFFR